MVAIPRSGTYLAGVGLTATLDDTVVFRAGAARRSGLTIDSGGRAIRRLRGRFTRREQQCKCGSDDLKHGDPSTGVGSNPDASMSGDSTFTGTVLAFSTTFLEE